MTIQDFSSVFALLAVQLRATDADEATIRGYFHALKHLELEFVKMAADRFAVSAEWFPKTSEWLEMAAKVEHERLELQKHILRHLPHPLCLVCQDTGWEPSDRGVARCACQKQRRLEVLGRRPMPAIPEWAPKALPVPAEVAATVKNLLDETERPRTGAMSRFGR